MTSEEMQSKLNAKIEQIISIGYSRKEATEMVEAAMVQVRNGNKSIRDIIDF